MPDKLMTFLPLMSFNRSAQTDTDGLYVIPSLRPATYRLMVEAKGFRSSRQMDIVLLADQTLTLNFAMSLGTTTETVTVVGNALQVDTSTSTLKQVIEQQRISELPLNGRNAAQLTLLVAGAVNSPNGGADQGATKTFPARDLLCKWRTAEFDQLPIGRWKLRGRIHEREPAVPFPDALQEFSVQTSNYSAEYGSNAGGVVNVITKSGTNSFHGDAFRVHRNPVFNAQNFFATPTTQDQVKRNQFGAPWEVPSARTKHFSSAATSERPSAISFLAVKMFPAKPTLRISCRRRRRRARLVERRQRRQLVRLA